MDYNSLRSRFNELYKKHALLNNVDASWLGRGLSPEEIIKAESALKCTLPSDIKLISAEISSFVYGETPYLMGDRSPEKLYPSLSGILQDDLEIQTVSSILEWGWGNDFSGLWDIEVDLIKLYIEKEGNIIETGEINAGNIINRDVVPIGFSSEGTLYINLYDHGKNIGSVMNLIQCDEIIIQTLSSSYEEFVGNMLYSLERIA